MAGVGGKRKAKAGGRAGKDPNAPKRGLSAFFCFCNEERPKVKAKFPNYTIGEVAKELGKRWEVCPNKSKFNDLAAKDKARYEKEMAAYKSGGSAPAKKPAGKAAPPAKKAKKVEEDDDDEEEEDESD